eukprot:768677-Hanusia_phi.AAC.11
MGNNGDDDGGDDDESKPGTLARVKQLLCTHHHLKLSHCLLNLPHLLFSLFPSTPSPSSLSRPLLPPPPTELSLSLNLRFFATNNVPQGLRLAVALYRPADRPAEAPGVSCSPCSAACPSLVSAIRRFVRRSEGSELIGCSGMSG